MKWISFIIILLFPSYAISQSDYSGKNGVGIHFTSDGIIGTSLSLRYTRQIADQGVMKFEIKFNRFGHYAGRIGYEFLQLRTGDFALGVGVDLKYGHIDLERYGRPSFDEIVMELPVELRYYTTPRHCLQVGFSTARRLRSTESLLTSASPEVELRIGLLHWF